MQTPILPFLLLFAVLTITSCVKKAEEHSHHHEVPAAPADPNKSLQDSVNAVHDEVMPRLSEIFNLSQALKEKLVQNPAMPTAQKQEIQAALDSLKSADDGMMIWMRQFRPPTDTSAREAARDYLKQEMVKVTKVKSSILSSIERAKKLK